MSRPVQQNSTGNKARVKLLDVDGNPWTGVAYNAAGLAISYTPLGGTPVAITLTAGNWTEKVYGGYEVDVPDAAYTGTAPIEITGAITNGVVIGEEHLIVDYDPPVLVSTVADAVASEIGAQTSTLVVPANVAESVAQPGQPTVMYRGTRWAITINDVGTLTGVTKIYFTVKRRDEPDADAKIQILLTIPGDAADGLQILNGAAGTAEHGSLVVEDYTEDATDKKRVIAYVEAAATTSLATGEVKYDFKAIGGTNSPSELGEGKINVRADVTRAIE